VFLENSFGGGSTGSADWAASTALASQNWSMAANLWFEPAAGRINK
jgi:hypothetical protein